MWSGSRNDRAAVSDHLPTASLERLRRRAALLGHVRQFFDDRGFWEVETPLLSADTVIDRHLDPVPVPSPLGGDTRSIYWLQTSPEFAMKRLLAAGADAIYQVTRAFRRDEWGPLHNPEFTMVEWYRVGDDSDRGITLLAELAEMLLRRGRVERASYRDVFLEHVRLDPHQARASELADVAHRLGVVVPASLDLEDRDSWLDLLMAERVQPHLGLARPLIVFDYPASQAALARVRTEDPPVAERFELYDRGIELANGYYELLDAELLAERQRQQNAWRVRDGKRALPEDNRLLDAMRSGLPPCTGVALGFDRLAMLVLGASSLSEVIAFPFPRA
jgi:lysyl-tRNA synthetase class 2